jgi:FK506-binding protein 6
MLSLQKQQKAGSGTSCDSRLTMDDLCYYGDNPECFQLKRGLDVSELNAGEGQEFEVDPDYVPDDDEENICENDGYKYFEQDFLTKGNEEDNDDEENEDGHGASVTQFDKISQKMVNLTEDGGVKKQVISQGIGDIIPPDSNVSIHYNAYLEYADEPFDSSYRRCRPHHFNLGAGNVIVGLDIAVKSMRKLEKAKFLIHPDYGLGPRGCPPRIPGNATCLYVVELVNYADSRSIEAFCCKSKEEQSEAPLEEILTVVQELRKRGSELFKAGNFKVARKSYLKAQSYLESYHLQDEDEENRVKMQMRGCCENIAVTCAKLDYLHQAIKFANKALEIDPNIARPHFVKGKALRRLGNFDAALTELRRALKLQPRSTEIANELKELERKQREFNAVERETCRRMFASHSSSKTSPGAAAVTGEKTGDKESTSSGLAVSAKFKELVTGTLTDFQNNPNLVECPFSTDMMDLEELGVVEQIARDLGLFVTPRKQQVSENKGYSIHIRVCKKVPEM